MQIRFHFFKGVVTKFLDKDEHKTSKRRSTVTECKAHLMWVSCAIFGKQKHMNGMEYMQVNKGERQLVNDYVQTDKRPTRDSHSRTNSSAVDTNHITNLTEELSRLQQVKWELENRCHSVEEEYSEVNKKFEDLKQTSNEMVISIQTLEHDNRALRQEVMKLKSDLCQQATALGQSDQSSGEVRNLETPKGKILILGDSLAYNIRNGLSRHLKYNFDISSVIKPNALIGDVVSDILRLAKNFDTNDYVVVMGGSVNLLNGIRVEEETIERLRVDKGYTNLILFSVPLWSDNSLLNKFINEHNKMMYDKVLSEQNGSLFLHFNAVVRSLEFFYRDGLFIAYRDPSTCHIPTAHVCTVQNQKEYCSIRLKTDY
ncbi:unnamed protein product [Ceutorhynchus assimilis]|uniref:Uncharacterized protein n=1 Tax=Ceutorhynchus assimilis TaxID=467358 RepID=A0A9N9MTB0_9CUCU|nr:unnamed protein product [Ceutorhynchus assimilis]